MDFSPDFLRTWLLPRPLRYFEQVGSTNDVALEWLREGAESGAVVVADEQTQGRGRLGRGWYAPPGTAIMLSVILRPPADAVGRMTMLGAVVVCELIERLGASDVSIKWPNDVRLNGRKVCGILPEAAWSGDELLGVVLGIGLNVRIDFTDTPFAETAISIEPALGRSVTRLSLVMALLTLLQRWERHAASDNLFQAWKRRLSMLGSRVTVNAPDGAVTGTAEDVDATGALLLRLDDGTLRRLIAGDIALGE